MAGVVEIMEVVAATVTVTVAVAVTPGVVAVPVAVTAVIAWKAIRTRNADGSADYVHLLFGCIAAVFFFLVLSQDVLGVAKF